MPNFRDWTASEIVTQLPQARNVLAKHLGPDSISTGSGASLRELAKWKKVDLDLVLRDLDAISKGNTMFT